MINTIIQYLLGHNDDGDIFGVNQVLCRMHFFKPKNCSALSNQLIMSEVNINKSYFCFR